MADGGFRVIYGFLLLAIIGVSALVGGVVLLFFGVLRLAEAAEAGLGEGRAQEVKRALSAMEGQLDDFAQLVLRREKRDDMARRRAAPSPAVQDERSARLARLRNMTSRPTQSTIQFNGGGE